MLTSEDNSEDGPFSLVNSTDEFNGLDAGVAAKAIMKKLKL